MDRTTRLGAVVLVGTLLARGALALDPPHDLSENSKQCNGCHLLHNSLGSSLTTQDTNANLCHSCHTSGGYGFPWTPDTQAQAAPGTSGYSHKWTGSATNATRGASLPLNANMVGHLGGTPGAETLLCSTCHDQHNNTIGGRTGTQHIRGAQGALAVGSSWVPNGNLTVPSVVPGTGSMRIAAVSAGATPKAYQVRITAIGGTTITFAISHDGGATQAVTGLTATAGGAAVSLDDGTNVQVAFPSAVNLYVVNDWWKFWVTYPFLQMPSANAEICVDCHRSRNMYWQDVEGGVAQTPSVPGGRLTSVTLGTTVFSHPVGQTLNAKANISDRTPATMLDVTGEPQATSTDSNKTNDLQLGTGDVVTCMSCHYVHNADSNSLSVDPR